MPTLSLKRQDIFNNTGISKKITIEEADGKKALICNTTAIRIQERCLAATGMTSTN